MLVISSEGLANAAQVAKPPVLSNGRKKTESANELKGTTASKSGLFGLVGDVYPTKLMLLCTLLTVMVTHPWHFDCNRIQFNGLLISVKS